MLLASTAALLASALTWAAQADAAPGNPGVPGPPATVFTEDFENVDDPALAQFLNTYTGPAPLAMTYTAHPTWINASLCNGTIASWNSTRNGTCSLHVFNNYIRPLARALGGGVGVGEDNQAMGDVTAGSGSAATPAATLETTQPIPLPATGRFITFSLDVGVVSCNAPHDPLLRWFLLDGPTEIPATDTAVNPCTDPRGSVVAGARVGNYASDSSILTSAAEIGLKLTNDQTGGSGNDYAVDGISVLDGTPQLDKDFEPSTSTGVPATLTFTITNTDDLAAKPGWSFTDTLPSGLAIATPTAAATDCPNGTIDATAGGTTIDVSGDLDAGQASCTATVEVVSPSPGTFENCAADLSDVVGLDLPACSSLNIGPASDLSLTKTAAPASPNPGDPLTYTLSISNDGPDPSPGATVTDTLPTGVDYVSDNGGCTYTPATRELSCPIGALGVGDPPVTITVDTTVDVGAGSTVQTNGAEVTGQNFDPDPNNNQDSVDVPVPPIADLSVTKSATPNPVNDGEEVTYTLEVANAGPTDSVVSLTDTLPPDLTYVSDDAGCIAAGQDISCDLGALTGGGPGTTVTIVAAVAPGASGSFTNDAEVASTDNPATPGIDPVPESNPGNNEDSVTVQIAPPESDLRLSKSVPPGTFHPGDQIPYTLTATNDGPDDSPSTTIADTLPAGLSYVSDDAGCTVAGQDISCNLGTLQNGASATVTVITRLDAVTGPSVTNSAGVTGDNPDPNPDDNLSAVSAATLAPATDAGTSESRCFFGRKVTILGTNGPDRIVGTPGPDVIDGRGGDDVIIGLGGNDFICGGRGDDRIIAGRGHDAVKGGPGDDVIRGNRGHDWLRGGPGDDRISGRQGNDRLMGNAGDDRLQGRKGRDLIYGGPGRDWAKGGRGFDKAAGVAKARAFGIERLFRLGNRKAPCPDRICRPSLTG